MHAAYGGVVPELASRDHIRRVLPLLQSVMSEAGHRLGDLDAIAYTQGPGLVGALLVGASIAESVAYALGIRAVGVHHLEGHLLSPLLSTPAPAFPFIALLISGGHTQLMRVSAVSEYSLLGETLDDAAGEAFDKTAKLLGLGYPGGPAVAALAERGRPGRFSLPRPMLPQLERYGDLDFSFSGLKTAVLTVARQQALDDQSRADLAAEFQAAVVDVLIAKALAALDRTDMDRLVVAGGVGANRHLRDRLTREVSRRGYRVFYPDLQFCTDNGAMIAFAAALRLALPSSVGAANDRHEFTVRPRWELEDLSSPMEGIG